MKLNKMTPLHKKYTLHFARHSIDFENVAKLFVIAIKTRRKKLQINVPGIVRSLMVELPLSSETSRNLPKGVLHENHVPSGLVNSQHSSLSL